MQPSLFEQGEHARYSRLCQEILVYDTFFPGDVENPFEAAQVEDVESTLLAGVEGSGLAAVEQCAEHIGLVKLRLGANGQQGVVPDPRSKVCQCYRCFDDPLVQCGVQGEVTRDGGA